MEVIKKYKVGVKCVIIIFNGVRMKEYNLKEMWKSFNGIIRVILDGIVFRMLIIVDCVKLYVRLWESLIIIVRYVYGDIYKVVEMKVEGKSKCEFVIIIENGEEKRELIYNFLDDGVVMGMYNLNKLIESFVRSCFSFVLDVK